MTANLFPILLAANKYRLIDFDLPPVFGLSSGPLIVLGLIIVSLVIGVLFANAVRMRDYGWKVGLILSTILVSVFVVLFGEFKLGVDLKGGVILVYEVNELETKQLRRGTADNTNFDMGQLLAVISKRLNPTGLKEIVVRPFGPKQVEIVVPEVDPAEIEEIKEKIRTGGVLQFMIVASNERDTELYETARQQSERAGEERLTRGVLDADGQQVGYWARLARERGEDSPFRAFETIPTGYIRDARTGEVIEWSAQERQLFANSPSAFAAYLKERGIANVDVLMVYDQDFAIRGDDLNPGLTRAGHDESFRPAIHFAMRTEGAIKMGHVTQENLHRKLAIIFDNELLSAPVIQSKITDNGQITGNFTQEEVDFVVGILKSGSMPVVMQKNPISENQIGSILGMDTIVKGSWSVLVSLVLVLAFTWGYYRFAGFVACCALILNLLLTMAIMIMLQAPLTLPGLAGLVLTVGMSVDSNVLIFERMREELSRGAALRMAIRNGFDRAMVTIVDSNLTTLLTAFVLYFIGTDQVKGFGITLILGILTSMYTAIFCARVVFDMGERMRWLKTLRMTHFLTKLDIDWVKLFGPAAVASIVVIGIGLVATVARGKGLFDIDLAGGTSVTFILNEPMPVEKVRARLDEVLPNTVDPKTNTKAQFNAYELSLAGDRQPPQTVYKVDSSLQDIELLKGKVREALRTESGKDLLKTYHVKMSQLAEAPLEAPPMSPSISAPGAAPTDLAPPSTKSAPPAPAEKRAAEQKSEAALPEAKPADEKPAAKPAEAAKKDETEKPAGCGDAEESQDEPKAKAEEPKAGEPKAGEPKAGEPKVGEPKNQEPKAEAAKTEAPQTEAASSSPAAAIPPVQPPPARSKFKTTATLNFPGSPISAASLKARIQTSAKAVVNQDLTEIEVDNDSWDRVDNSTFDQWKVTLPLAEEQARKVFDRLQTDLDNAVVWQTSSEIGGQVSADTRFKAVTAIVVSLLGIVAYMWFRFQKAVWGIAAVVALAHDTLVMLGGIAVSYWLVDLLGFAGVEQFKISLPVIAAFLTLIGYSVNDTIVIFDRVREIRGKSPHLTRQMLNDAVNLTMSRTILTSGTVFIVVIVLYFFGGPGIHAFAFSLVIGVISGTYSTVFIAAPLLLWMFNREQSGTPAKVESRPATKSVA